MVLRYDTNRWCGSYTNKEDADSTDNKVLPEILVYDILFHMSLILNEV